MVTNTTWKAICTQEEISEESEIIIISDETCEDCVKVAINPSVDFSDDELAEIEDSVFGCTITVLNRGELAHLVSKLSFLETVFFAKEKVKIGTHYMWVKDKEFRGYLLFDDTKLDHNMIYVLFKDGKTSIVCPEKSDDTGIKVLCAYLISGAVPSNLAQPHLVKQLREAYKNFSDEKIEGIISAYDAQNPGRKNLFRERNLQFLSREKEKNILSDLI